MDEDAPHRLRWPRVLARVAGCVVLAAVLYPLSIGPVCYLLEERTHRMERALTAFYQPLLVLVKNKSPLAPIVPYYDWWRTLPGGPETRSLREDVPVE